MSGLREAAQQALEALDQLTDAVDGTGFSSKPSFTFALDTIDALRAALAAAAAAAEPDVPETRFGDMPERLRTYSADTELSDRYSDAMQEAADEIEQLREQNTMLDAKLAQLEAAAVAEPISVVAVAEVVDREEGPDLNWLLEGGICELPAGVVLLMSDKPLTDADGHGHVYAAPPQRKPLTDEEIRRMKPISPDLVDFRSGVRCAERAHGIGGSDE